MKRLPTALVLAALFLSLPVAPAQERVARKRTLPELQAAFDQEWQKLQAKSEFGPSREEFQALIRRQATELETFLEHEAEGIDRFNGVLMLTDMRMSIGDAAGATAALDKLDVEAAPPLILLTGADMAGRLGQRDRRTAWIDAAMGKSAPFEERMAMGTFLMTALVEVQKGEKIFADALAAAADDEARARVRWFRCAAIREREDLPEGAYQEALQELAGDLPATYFGGVARDRLRASEFAPGREPIPFSVQDLDGNPVSLAQLKGKVVLLDFWASWDPPCRESAPKLVKLHETHAADGLVIVGISLDTDPAQARAAAAELGFDWPQICDGRGWQADLALRYRVEKIPTMIAIGRDGKIAGLNLHLETGFAEREVDEVLQRALKAGS